jgi:hypothetical protein
MCNMCLHRYSFTLPWPWIFLSGLTKRLINFVKTVFGEGIRKKRGSLPCGMGLRYAGQLNWANSTFPTLETLAGH